MAALVWYAYEVKSMSHLSLAPWLWFEEAEEPQRLKKLIKIEHSVLLMELHVPPVL